MSEKLEGMVTYVTYSSEETMIVEKGISAIREVLMGNDTEKKRSLLFCLDRYMDPYFGHDISAMWEELVNLLQTIVVSEKEEKVIEDALDLLRDYVEEPLPILEKNLDHITFPATKRHAEYVVNQHRIQEIETLVNEECKRMYLEASRLPQNREGFPDSALIVHDDRIKMDDGRDPQESITDFCDGLFQIKDGEVREIDIPISGIPYLRTPLSGGFFPTAELYYGIDLKNRMVCLKYLFGPAYAGCMEYRILGEDGLYTLSASETKQ